MKLSHSKIETYEKCPYKYKLQYIEELKTLPADDYANPLILGHALHTGIEKDVKDAIDEYYNSYPVINDMHITEAMKLEYLIPKVKELLPEGLHEVKIEDEDFIGFIDLLVPVEPLPIFIDGYEGDKFTIEMKLDLDNEYYDLYDFKYSNNISSYLESNQLHLYKYYYEKITSGKKIRNLYFVFVPKSQLRIKYKNKTNPRDETIYEFRQRVMEDLDTKEIKIQQIKYNPNKVIEFLTNAKHTIEDTTFKKNEGRLCDFCEYKKYCLEGIDYEII